MALSDSIFDASDVLREALEDYKDWDYLPEMIEVVEAYQKDLLYLGGWIGLSTEYTPWEEFRDGRRKEEASKEERVKRGPVL